ncbi:MAG: ATP-binding protein [Clostridia bacterium]|nr:ATP-binding protein [Clostridia bacterium]
MKLDALKLGESKNVEFKEKLPKNSEKYLKSIIAFSNTSGGKLIIGIKDQTGEIVGVTEDNIFKIMDQITNAISDNSIPQIVPNIYIQSIEGKSVIVIEVYPGQMRPYYLKSLGKEQGTYVRIAGTSRPADQAMIKDLELAGANRSYDSLVVIGEELNMEEVNKLCQTIEKYKRDAFKQKGRDAEVPKVTLHQLERWEVIQNIDGKFYPTHAFKLLTDNPYSFAKIQCGRFKGKTRSVFLDKREFTGAIYDQIEEAYQFVLKHINLGAEINGILRQDVYELPLVSIRESISNAVTHRNYIDHSSIQVLVFDDRLEVTSPGMLYGGLTVNLIKTGKSKIRNKAIAEVFAQMGIIESWGTGIQRMIDGCLEMGVPEPVFEELGDSFRVTIYRPSAQTLISNNLSYYRIQEEANPVIVLRALKNEDLTRREVEYLTNLSKSGARNLLEELMSQGKVEAIGRGRATKYRLKKKYD